MSFQNSGTTPSGRPFRRTEGVLVRDGGLVLAGHIAEISESDGEIFINAMVCQGIRGSLDSVQKPDPSLYVTGLRHQSTKLVRGEAAVRTTRLFCFADETPNWADAEAAAASTPTEVTQDVSEGNQGDTAPLPQPAPTQVHDPRDLNQDGAVTKEEKKEHKRQNPTV